MIDKGCTKKTLNQSGQATTEAVLLLILSVAIVVGLSVQLFKPFNTFLKNYMGEYLICLLDAGELPKLGSDAQGICDESFKPFTVANGRPLKDGKGGAQSASELANSSSNKKDGNGTSSGGAGAAAGSSRSGSRKSIGFDINKTGAADGASAKDNKTTQFGESTRSKYFKSVNVGQASAGGYQKRIQAVGFAGFLSKVRDKNKGLQAKNRTVSSVEESSGKKNDKKLSVQAKAKKMQIEDDAPIEWGLGKIFRFAIILALIIAILLFLGGQAMQISKSMEKG